MCPPEFGTTHLNIRERRRVNALDSCRWVRGRKIRNEVR